jgi:uncharacterized protein DUF5666
MRRFSSVVPAAIVAAIVAGACGKSGPASPAAPSSSSPSAPGAPVAGATIAGTLMSGIGTSAFRPAGSTLTVSIVGTSISVIVDAAGRFTLQHVPSGDVTLAFTGGSVDARVTLTGVIVNDQIRITVRLNGNVAEIDEDENEHANNEAEIHGAVTATSCAASPPTIVVGTATPTTVNVQGARIRHDGDTLTCAQIHVGDRVEVHGTKSGATIVATDVNDKTDHGAQAPPPGDDHGHDGDDHDEAEVNGTVSGAAANHVCPAFTFSVGSTVVTTTSSTKFEDTSCAGVVNGVSVEVKGTRTGASAITATKVERKK